MIIVQRLTFISLPELKPIETHAEYTLFPAIREQWGGKLQKDLTLGMNCESRIRSAGSCMTCSMTTISIKGGKHTDHHC